MKVLVTGSSGLVGSEIVSHFDALGARVIGVDNNQRADFFGSEGDTGWNLARLARSTRSFEHVAMDVRDREGLNRLLQRRGPFDLVAHCAGQPSHDLSAKLPLEDFEVNALGTINLLEAVRTTSPEAVFVLLSTNKVYGDAPNELPLVEGPLRYDYARPEDAEGIDESMRIDASLHSPFGASKAAADLVTQEYGRYFGLRTYCLRCGCITGNRHSGVELHGFLSFLARAANEGRTYKVYGHRGKQVRDNIHAADVAHAIEALLHSSRPHGVYNLGGGRANSCSILEAIGRIEALTGKRLATEHIEQARLGDHACYITNLRRFRGDHPGWDLTRGLDDIFKELVEGWRGRVVA